MRWLRRWWARITHRHDWVVIWRGRVLWKIKSSGEKGRNPAMLERCHCGQERAKEYRHGKWQHLDLDWLNWSFADQGTEIPARHQE